MAEKKAVGHAYNIDFLNVVFAASSLFLFLSVIWMVWDDFDRGWKKTQRDFNRLEIEVTRATYDQASRAIDRKRLQQLETQRAEAEKNVAANRQKVDELQRQLKDVEIRLFRATQAAQFTKATYDVDRYDFEVARDQKSSSTESKRKHVDELERTLNEQNLALESVTAERAKSQQQLAQYTGVITDVGKKIEELTAEQTRLSKRLDVISPSVVKDYFRNAPLLDFMAPTIKVQQVITPDVVDDVNFTRVAKMDRCMTCHLGIDKKGYEKYPQPYTTHPNLSMFLGGDSPHPLERVGCTVCHEGMGQSVSFTDASHFPRHEKQQREWEEKYGWEEPHLWDYPMLPANMTEASCVKCHRGEAYVPTAQKLGLAYSTYERAGCYACHKTKGFEDLRKPGPILTKIEAKLKPEWVKNWIRNPRAVKPATWMPRPWYNSNSSSPEDAVRNEVEINATVAYLFANSETHQFAVASPPKGNVESGALLVKNVGCLACHINEADMSRTAAGPRRTFGQPLENIGNKTTYEWVFDWVRNPKHFNADTYMPNMRLTDPQAADVAAYLMTLKGPAGESAKATPDQKAVDDVLLDYLTATLPVEDAKSVLAKMDGTRKQVELGQRVIARYGCFSCHEIKGFEKQQPIGIELSEEGTKLLTRLDFGFVNIPHSKIDWFHQKVRDPRIFDKGRVLRPNEKLRMPDYGMSEEEAERLVMAVMSLQRDIQPQQALPARSARRDALIAGRAFVRRRNCVACHTIEDDGGDYKTLLADASLAPPLLTPEGAKVQPDWLYAFLRGPITIRPWLDVKMPTFGLDDPHLNEAIRYFAGISNSIGPFQSHDAVRTSNLAGPGKPVFELLKCQQCHVLGAIPKDQPTSNLAPDLRMASERLEPEWILDWLKGPAKIQPGTRMPSFWPEFPKSYYPQFNGDAEMQIRAIRDHLLTLKGGPSPKRPVAAPTAQVAEN